MINEMNLFFQNVKNNVWANSLFRWFFYICMIIILLLQTRKSVKITFCYYSTVFLLLLYNPITYIVIRRIFSEQPLAYCSRLYEMVPIVYIIAMGLIQVLLRIRQKAIWAVSFIVLACVIALVGGENGYAYGKSWMKEIQNFEKVPEESIEICKMLHDDENAITIVNDA